jgi:hypothetical protein
MPPVKKAAIPIVGDGGSLVDRRQKTIDKTETGDPYLAGDSNS